MLWTLEVTEWYSETGQPGTLVSMLTEVNISAAKCIDVLYITSNLSFLDMMFFLFSNIAPLNEAIITGDDN